MPALAQYNDFDKVSGILDRHFSVLQQLISSPLNPTKGDFS